MIASSDKHLWQSIGDARYDFGAVGAALFSLFGLVASGVASAHVVTTLFAATTKDGTAAWDAIAYGIALFLLAEGVAYYIEIYALFEGDLRWWLWLLRWVGPGLSAGAGGLAAYSWLPEEYKWLCAITTLILPLFQWGFLSILMDRIRAIHSRRLQESAPEATPMQQLVQMYQEVQQQRARDDLARLQEMIVMDRSLPLMMARVPEQPTYPAPIATMTDLGDIFGTDQDAEPNNDDIPAWLKPAATDEASNRNAPKTYTCKKCGTAGFSFQELGLHSRKCKQAAEPPPAHPPLATKHEEERG